MKEKNHIIESMHNESVEKDKQIIEGNQKLMVQITKLRSDIEENARNEELRLRQSKHKYNSQMDYIYR